MFKFPLKFKKTLEDKIEYVIAQIWADGYSCGHFGISTWTPASKGEYYIPWIMGLIREDRQKTRDYCIKPGLLKKNGKF